MRSAASTRPTTESTIDNTTQASVGKIKLLAMRRFGARAGALAGVAMGVGMVAAAAVTDHTTPSVAGFFG